MLCCRFIGSAKNNLWKGECHGYPTNTGHRMIGLTLLVTYFFVFALSSAYNVEQPNLTASTDEEPNIIVSNDDPIGEINCTKPYSLPVRGQGLFLFTDDEVKTVTIRVSPDDENWHVGTADYYIALVVEQNRTSFIMKTGKGKVPQILKEVNAPSVGTQGERVTYWFSYDRVGKILKYGKGYAMEETTLMEHDFVAHNSTRNGEDLDLVFPFFSPEVERHVCVDVVPLTMKGASLIDVTPPFMMLPDPFVSNFPPIVLDSAKVKLYDLDRDMYMFSSRLPRACQEVYGNIKNIELEEQVDPVIKLTDAMRYSINTPGCLLYEKLKNKSSEFGHSEPKMTYLRVTLGRDQRTAPGIPYVLEIWPSGHYSPIHNHGGACAVIKVLHGSINIKVFNKMTNPPTNDSVIKSFDGRKGDVTWLDTYWYQTHQLLNRNDDFCATIQCYRYAEDDKLHWPNFDFEKTSPHKSVSAVQMDKTMGEFLPNSDFTFIYMRYKVIEEYKKYLSG